LLRQTHRLPSPLQPLLLPPPAAERLHQAGHRLRLLLRRRGYCWAANHPQDLQLQQLLLRLGLLIGCCGPRCIHHPQLLLLHLLFRLMHGVRLTQRCEAATGPANPPTAGWPLLPLPLQLLPSLPLLRPRWGCWAGRQQRVAAVVSLRWQS
jgi:hypothetical protein